jgi:Type IV secretion-system coupling protein DNA-binding domain
MVDPVVWQANRVQLLGCLLCATVGLHQLRRWLVRGTRRRVGEAMRERRVESTPANPGYFWAGESLPFEEACKHFVAIGGKSITLNLLAQSVLLKMGQKDGITRRVILYDPKSDLASFVASINPAVTIHIMNAMDRRFIPWDISADLQTETDAQEFAAILIPKNERENSPYFSDAARSLVAGVVKRLTATTQPGERWTLRDLVLACETTSRLNRVLDHETTRYLGEHFHPENQRNYAGVKSTLDNALSLYRPIAALGDASKSEPLSLRRWMTSKDTVLLLGNHESAREATDTLNRLLFRQLSKLIIDRPGRVEHDETWIFLDEVREAGALSGLRQLLLRGRSKGVAVAQGFQAIEGMFAAYGEQEGAEIVGAAQNLVLLHINPTAPDTAEWASTVFSSRCDYVSAKSVTMGERISTTKNQQLDLVPNVLPVEFVELPMPSPKRGLHYFAFTNTKGYGRGHYEWSFLENEGKLGGRKEEFMDFEPQEDRDAFVLRPWDEDDLRRLGLVELTLQPKDIDRSEHLRGHPIDGVRLVQ